LQELCRGRPVRARVISVINERGLHQTNASW
jgi:hypothetical protein